MNKIIFVDESGNTGANYSDEKDAILTLPIAKARGFLFLPLLHWLIPKGIATSYTVSTS